MTSVLLLLLGCDPAAPAPAEPSCQLRSPGLLCTWKRDVYRPVDLSPSLDGGFFYIESCCVGELGSDARTVGKYGNAGSAYGVTADLEEHSVAWVGGLMFEDGIYRADGVSGTITRESDDWRMEVESSEPDFLASYYYTSALGFDTAGRLYMLVGAMEAVIRLEGGVVTAFAGMPVNLNDHPGMFNGDQELADEVHLGLTTNQYGYASGFALDDKWLYLPVFKQHVVVRVDLDSGILYHIAGDPTALDRWHGFIAETPRPEEGVDALQTDLHYPSDVALAPDGSVYVLEAVRSCVRRFTVGGTIHTVAGICGERSDTGEEDGAPATETRLSSPTTIAVDEAGNLYIGEQGSHSIRVVYAER